MPSSPGQTLTTHHCSVVSGQSFYACHSLIALIELLVSRATDNMSWCVHSAAVHVLGGQSLERSFSNWFCLSLIFPLDDCLFMHETPFLFSAYSQQENVIIQNLVKMIILAVGHL